MILKVISCEGKYRVYCMFCDHDITPDDGSEINGSFNCKYCTFPVHFICQGSMWRPEVFYTQFIVNNYMIELDYSKGTCWLFKAQVQKAVLHLNYLPPITPANCEDWLERLLDLSAFS